RRRHSPSRSLIWTTAMNITKTVAVLVLASVTAMHAQQAPLLAQIDHLVYATPDLDLGATTIEKALGIQATPGGQHPGMGTRNALVALGPTSYLEIIGPDPDQRKPAGRRRFGVDGLKAPRVIGWVAKSRELEAISARAAASGVPLGAVIPG